MLSMKTIPDALSSKNAIAYFSQLYGDDPGVIETQILRYQELADTFSTEFPNRNKLDFFSAPGRTEVGGNHTDHNAGRILAAAVDLDIAAAAVPNDEGVIRMHSAGYPPDFIDLSDLSIRETEKFSSTAIIRGVAARFKQLGYRLGGFDAAATSSVPKGSGLSSSAAFEVLIGLILSHFYNNNDLDPVLLAKVGQYAENQYFGKPCGLMDQTTSAVGGFVTIDFNDVENPIVQQVRFDFAASGYTLVIVDTRGDHADLNDEYTALENEMKAVANALGGKVLRDFSAQAVLEQMGALRSEVGDRAILRALHFYGDDQRVVEQVWALEGNNFPQFLDLIIESGYSSWMYCQNVFAPNAVHKQELAIALAASQSYLQGHGAWRVHGGGFAGTIQAFVPQTMLAGYVEMMEKIFGEGACHLLRVRPVGGVRMPN